MKLFFFLVVSKFFFFYIYPRKKMYISIYRRKSWSCWNFWEKCNWLLGARAWLIKFFYPSGGNRKGSVCLACCGGKCITSPRATYTCHLVSGWLSLQMYSSNQEESLKKSQETYKVNKMAYDLFFVQYFMMYKKNPKHGGFPFDFPFKRQIL